MKLKVIIRNSQGCSDTLIRSFTTNEDVIATQELLDWIKDSVPLKVGLEIDYEVNEC